MAELSRMSVDLVPENHSSIDSSKTQSDSSGHPLGITQRGKQKQQHRRVDKRDTVETLHTSGPPTNTPNTKSITSRDVRSMEDFSSTRTFFPESVGLYPFGNFEKGYKKFLTEKVLPENTDAISRKILLYLEDKYNQAFHLYDLLHGKSTPGSKPSRRFLSRSDETDGAQTSTESNLDDILQKILVAEFLFKAHKEKKQLELEQTKLSKNLLQAIETANKGTLINTLGDYYAALCKDFRESGVFTKPSDRPKWCFQGCSKYSEIIDAYDKEQEKLKEDPTLVPSDIPMTTSLKLAYDYLGGRYTGVEQIVSHLRGYAMRNIQVHPVKQYFEEGNHSGLRSAIIRDYACIPFLGNSEDSEKEKEEVRKVLDFVIKRFYSDWSWDDHGYISPSPTFKKLREQYEEKLALKDPFYKNKPFADEDTKKGDRTREKSLAEEIEHEEHLTEEGKYERAIAQCQGEFPGVAANPFVESVLKGFHEKAEDLQEELARRAEASSRAHKHWNNAMSAAATAKAKYKKKLEELRKQKDARIEELEAEVERLKN